MGKARRRSEGGAGRRKVGGLEGRLRLAEGESEGKGMTVEL